MNTDLIQDHASQVVEAIKKYEDVHPITLEEILNTKPYLFDFSENNAELAALDLTDENAFIGYVTNTIKESGAKYAMGGYGEDRILYRRSPLFAQEAEPRSVHLGVDVWLPEGTPIFAPIEGKIHSYQDNAVFGDYGPTIILEHNLNGVIFYTLYGHLSRPSLERLSVGMEIAKGEQLATIGSYKVNGNWPSHVHFEIITDMQGKSGDFPGVSSVANKDYFLTLCPDPNLILRSRNYE